MVVNIRGQLGWGVPSRCSRSRLLHVLLMQREDVAGEKSILMPGVLKAKSARGATMLMAMPVSTLSMTVFYGFPNAFCSICQQTLHAGNL